MRFLAALKIIDINLAKGDTQKALAQINSFKRNFKSGDEKLILKIIRLFIAGVIYAKSY